MITRHDTTIIITAFFYSKNGKNIFNPKYLFYDIYNIINYALTHLQVYISGIYIITDKYPDKDKLRSLEDTLNQLAIKNMSETWIEWLYRNNYIIYNNLSQILSKNNAIEFTYLLCQYQYVYTGIKEYMYYLENITKKSSNKIIYYYTGHGLYQHLMIPIYNHVELLDAHILANMLKPLINKKDVFMIYDCCYSESIIKSLGKLLNKNIILIGSTRSDQTCGFMENAGSLFSYYLFELLKKVNKITKNDIIKLDTEICLYRKNRNKPNQNIYFINNE